MWARFGRWRSGARGRPRTERLALHITAGLGFSLPDGVGRAKGVNDGNGFLFISHLGEIYPSGFLPVSAGNVRTDDLVEAYGSPTVSGEAQELTGEILYYDLATRRATAMRARTEVTESATWIVRGDLTVEQGEVTRLFATGGHSTTCASTAASLPFCNCSAAR